MAIGTWPHVRYQIYAESRGPPFLDWLGAYESGIQAASHAALLVELLPQHWRALPSICGAWG